MRTRDGKKEKERETERKKGEETSSALYKQQFTLKNVAVGSLLISDILTLVKRIKLQKNNSIRELTLKILKYFLILYVQESMTQHKKQL